MAKFKCLLSGNTIELTDKVDIDSMQGHEGYVLVEDEAPAKTTITTAKKQVSKTKSVSAATSEAE